MKRTNRSTLRRAIEKKFGKSVSVAMADAEVQAHGKVELQQSPGMTNMCWPTKGDMSTCMGTTVRHIRVDKENVDVSIGEETLSSTNTRKRSLPMDTVFSEREPILPRQLARRTAEESSGLILRPDVYVSPKRQVLQRSLPTHDPQNKTDEPIDGPRALAIHKASPLPLPATPLRSPDFIDMNCPPVPDSPIPTTLNTSSIPVEELMRWAGMRDLSECKSSSANPSSGQNVTALPHIRSLRDGPGRLGKLEHIATAWPKHHNSPRETPECVGDERISHPVLVHRQAKADFIDEDTIREAEISAYDAMCAEHPGSRHRSDISAQFSKANHIPNQPHISTYQSETTRYPFIPDGASAPASSFYIVPESHIFALANMHALEGEHEQIKQQLQTAKQDLRHAHATHEAAKSTWAHEEEDYMEQLARTNIEKKELYEKFLMVKQTKDVLERLYKKQLRRERLSLRAVRRLRKRCRRYGNGNGVDGMQTDDEDDSEKELTEEQEAAMEYIDEEKIVEKVMDGTWSKDLQDLMMMKSDDDGSSGKDCTGDECDIVAERIAMGMPVGGSVGVPRWGV